MHLCLDMCGHLAQQVPTYPVCQGSLCLNALLLSSAQWCDRTRALHARKTDSVPRWTLDLLGTRWSPASYLRKPLYSDGGNRSCLLTLPRAVRRDLTKTICLSVTLHHRIGSRASTSCFVIFIFCVACKFKLKYLSAADWLQKLWTELWSVSTLRFRLAHLHTIWHNLFCTNLDSVLFSFYRVNAHLSSIILQNAGMENEHSCLNEKCFL